MFLTEACVDCIQKMKKNVLSDWSLRLRMHWFIVRCPCEQHGVSVQLQLHERSCMHRHRHTNAERVSLLRLPFVVVRTSKSELFSKFLLNDGIGSLFAIFFSAVGRLPIFHLYYNIRFRIFAHICFVPVYVHSFQTHFAKIHCCFSLWILCRLSNFGGFLE